MKYTKEPYIEDYVTLQNVTFDIYNKVGEHCVLENVKMGRYSYIEPNGIMQNTILKNFVDIARNVRVGATQHPVERPTTHHITYRRAMYDLGDNDDAFFEKREGTHTIIGHDVWIGHGAVIQAGIQIGNGAVIGSNAVVTKDIPPYAIAAGVPAKILRYRFDREQIQKLEEIAWWDWEDDIFRMNINDFYLPIDAFIKKHWKGVKHGISFGNTEFI